MKRKILLQLVLPLLGLIALFSMLAFAPNSAQRHPALLEMSVILREADSSILSTTRHGCTISWNQQDCRGAGFHLALKELDLLLRAVVRSRG